MNQRDFELQFSLLGLAVVALLAGLYFVLWWGLHTNAVAAPSDEQQIRQMCLNGYAQVCPVPSEPLRCYAVTLYADKRTCWRYYRRSTPVHGY